MKTCVSGTGGAIRALYFFGHITGHLSKKLGYSIYEGTDQGIGTSATTINFTQSNLDITADTRKEIGIDAFFDGINNQNRLDSKKIFPDIKGVLKRHAIFKTAYDQKTLPSIIDKNFNNPKMGDFLTRMAFTVYDENLPWQNRTRLITSYDNPDCPVSHAVGASCSFPTIFPAYEFKDQWLDKNGDPSKIHQFWDGGLQNPNPSILGLKEVKKIAKPHEKITVLSIMAMEEKHHDYTKLKNGSLSKWLHPGNKTPLVRIPFSGLHTQPDHALQLQAELNPDRFEYIPIHVCITEEHRKKYGVSFDSDDSSDQNLDGFEQFMHDYIGSEAFKPLEENALNMFENRRTEKLRENNIIPFIPALEEEKEITGRPRIAASNDVVHLKI